MSIDERLFVTRSLTIPQSRQIRAGSHALGATGKVKAIRLVH